MLGSSRFAKWLLNGRIREAGHIRCYRRTKKRRSNRQQHRQFALSKATKIEIAHARFTAAPMPNTIPPVTAAQEKPSM